MKSKEIYDRGQLWKIFLRKFHEVHGKKLIQDNETIGNLSVLFHYFL